MAKNPIKEQEVAVNKAQQAQRQATKNKKQLQEAELSLSLLPDDTPGDVARPGNPVTVVDVADLPNSSKKDKMSEEDVNSYVSRALEGALNWGNDQSAFRALAQQYYDAIADGDLSAPQIDGRSSFVSSDVSDVIEAAMPMLIETFMASGNIVEFNAKKQVDEEGAKQITDLCNHLFLEDNPGYQILTEWFRDALLNRFGVVAVRWDENDSKSREEYQGLTDAQLGILMNDEQVEIVEMESFPDPSLLRIAEMKQLQDQQAYQGYQLALNQGGMNGDNLA